MDPALLTLVLILLTALLSILALLQHRIAVRTELKALEQRDEARQRGSHRAQLQYPWIDLSRCFGCGLCVAACPEEQVLDIIHGQAQVVHGARCVGHARCVDVCPVDAVEVTIEDLENRRDIPALNDVREATSSPGLFLAGEITGFALVRTAITHGTEVAREVARRLEQEPDRDSAVHDLVIIGGGPAGIACALESKRLGIRPMILEQESVGGTVAKYPRRKLVMTQPVELPLYGMFDRTEVTKEELIALWEDVVEKAELRIETGVRFDGLEKNGAGFIVNTDRGQTRARYVCLAVGRRGSPRKLGVPGEDLPKVTYSLVDARSYRGRKILVVGGGDSAIEAAIGLAEQPGNEVTLSYRKNAFFRIKPKNERRLDDMVKSEKIRLVFESQVESVAQDSVILRIAGKDGEQKVRVLNDDVFVFVGGIPPFEMLESAGVSFRPEDRPPLTPLAEKGTGLLYAFGGVALFVIATIGWWLLNLDYYSLTPLERLYSPRHGMLRAAGPFGLGMGILAVVAMLWNLTYLVRRSRFGKKMPGTLSFWMSSHVFTGVLALVAVYVHAGGSPKPSPGGHSFTLMTIVVVAGAIGRYLYSFVPRAANGRELALDETRAELLVALDGWEAPPGAQIDLRAVKADLMSWVEGDRWRGGFFGRLGRLLTVGARARRWFRERERKGLFAGLDATQKAQFQSGLVRAHRAALSATHWEDLRGILATWRYLHRWLAALLVLVLALHIVMSLRYATFGSGATG